MKKETAKDEIVGSNHQLKEHEFEKTPRDSEGQGSLGCFSPWCGRELDMTEQVTTTNPKVLHL